MKLAHFFFYWSSCILCGVSASKILGIFPHPGKSHYIMFEPLMMALAKKGHEVDVVTQFPSGKDISGYAEISIRGSLPIQVNNLSMEIYEGFDYEKHIIGLTEMCGPDVCEATLKHPKMHELKNSSKSYDLVLTEVFATDCMLAFGHHFKTPVVSMTSSINLPWGADRIGNPDNPSYIPNYFMHASGLMGLYERIVNTWVMLQAKFLYHQISNRETNRILRDFFNNEDFPKVEDLALNTSLLLVNSHFSSDQARPTVPNFVEVAGMHIREPKPLNEHFEELFRNATNGIIYFSMGSLLKVESIPQDKLQGILAAFEELPHEILWKGTTETFPKNMQIPKNVHVEPWVPQVDVLCDPNVKLFVTHGGQLGSLEATYCGVPRLTIPLFGEQQSNARQAERKNVAIRVNYEDVSKKTILSAAKKLLYDPKYKENAAILSRQFKDRPMSPLDTAIYWVEYVIRHRGAPQLRSLGADLPWYQYHLLDVGFVLISIIALCIYGANYLLGFILRIFSRPQKCKTD